MGKTQPVPGVTCTMTAMKPLIACLAPNRRVEVEVKGEADRQVTPSRRRKSPASRGAFLRSRRAALDPRAGYACDVDPRYASVMRPATRIDAGWIVPIEPAGALPNHAAHRRRADASSPSCPSRWRDDRFDARGASRAAAARAAAGSRQRPHACGDEPLPRHRRRRLRSQVWLEQHIWPREARFVAPDFVHDGARLAAAEMLRGGITCCNDMYFFPTRARAPSSSSGCARCWACRSSIFRRPTPPDADGYLARGLAMRDALQARADASRSRWPRTRPTP